MQNIKSLLDKLFSKQRRGIVPGLERISELLEYLDNPQNSFKSIHIAGTNGKGSICNMLASIMDESNYSTGLYTSPHIYRFNERMKVNNIEITDQELIDIYSLIEDKSDEINATFFEITTAICFEFFRRKNIDVAILETGMGGRYDATNIVNPIISVIASISMDHRDYLGNTISQVTTEKAGIIKNNTPIVLSQNEKKITDQIEQIAINHSSKFIESKDIPLKILNLNNNLTMTLEYNYNSKKFEINSPFVGEHQLKNIKSVLATIQEIRDIFKNININSIIKGIEETKNKLNLIGRLDIINENPNILITGAHNIDALNQDIKTLMNCGHYLSQYDIFFTCMNDKDYKKMLKTLRKNKNSIHLVNIEEERAIDLKILYQVAQQNDFANIEIVNTNELVNRIKSKKNNILIIGSFFLVSEVLKNIN